MAIDNPYLKMQVETSSPVDRVVLLYDKVIVLLKEAKEAIEREDLKVKIESIGKADRIIRILDASLDMEKGGEVAKNLRDIYDFILFSLIKVNAKNDINLLQDLIGILETLRSAWEEIKNKV